MIKKFNIEVKDFPEYDIKIVSLSPNPAGRDSENEWIRIKNQSKNKINLKNWSIATGWDNLYNHPIYEDFYIDPENTEILKRDICFFALHNKKSKIEIRYPNKETAYELEYEREDGVGEDEIYENIDGEWVWVKPIEEEDKEEFAVSSEASKGDDSEFIGRQSMMKENDYRIILLTKGTRFKIPAGLLNNKGKVLGVFVSKEDNEKYFFTLIENVSESYRLRGIIKGLLWKINKMIVN